MSNNHHAPIQTGQSNAPGTWNAPMGELDAAIEYNRNQLNGLNLSASTLVTRSDGGAASGAVSLIVDSTGGFLTGDTIGYTSSNGYEERSATVSDGTTFAVAATSGVVADNAIVALIPPAITNASSAINYGGTVSTPTLPDAMQWTGVGAYNVRAYGAVGDGVTDDKAAIQAAVDAAEAAGGGSVLLSEATYHIDSALTIDTAGVRLVGKGPGKTIIDGGGAAINAIDCQVSADIEGVKFNDFNGYAIELSNAISQVERLHVRNCSFSSMSFAIQQDSTSTVGVKDAIVEGCTFDLCDIGVRFAGEVAEDIRVIGNRFTRMTSSGIFLGHNIDTTGDATAADGLRRYVIIGNQIEDVDDTVATARIGAGGADTHGIICYGREVVIIGNQIKDVVNDAGTGCEGIYTKCRYGVIAHNILIDAGRRDGAIMLKGSGRTGQTSPQGYGMRCLGNSIFSSGGTYSNGIGIYRGDCLVADNIIEGMDGTGIHVSEPDLENVVISRNTLINCANSDNDDVIEVNYRIDDLIVEGNIIDGSGATGSVNGIHIFNPAATASTNVVVRGNIIKLSSPASGDARAIRIGSSAGGGGISDVHIYDNICDAADYGIWFQTDSGVVFAEIHDNDLSLPTTKIHQLISVTACTGYRVGENRGVDVLPHSLGNDATPSVAKNWLGLFYIPDTAASNITDFDTSQNGDIIYVRGNTTAGIDIVHGGNILTRSGSNISPLVGQMYAFKRFNGKWYEI